MGTQEPEVSEMTEEKKKRAIVKKKKVLAGHFVGEDGSFKSKKGKKHKESAASTAEEAFTEQENEPAALEPEVPEEVETAEQPEERKKPIVKKKRALGGKFVGAGEDGKLSFGGKKAMGKETEEDALAEDLEVVEGPEEEAVEEVESVKHSEEEKKPIVKKKRALGGRFVGAGEDGKPSFGGKKALSKETEEEALAEDLEVVEGPEEEAVEEVESADH